MSENNEKTDASVEAKAAKNDKKQAKKKVKKERKRPFAEMFSELKKTSWPGKTDLRNYAACVVLFVVVCSILLFAMDWIVGEFTTYISDAEKLPSVLNGWFGLGG